MEAGTSAREVALLALSAFERQGAWSDGFLKKSIRSAGLNGRDAALCTRLCFGVMQNRMRLDFYLCQFSTVPLEKLEERVRQSLRLGAYQICCLDRIPHRAAVNESVNLARKYARHPRAAGLVNGVLRSLARSRDKLPIPPDLATRYSHPSWLVESLISQLGREGAEALMAENNGQPPTCAQVNTCRFSAEEVRKRLEQEGVETEFHPWLPDCLLLTGTGDLERLKSFQEGAFYIQDPAARLAVLASEPQQGMQVLDVCAAPGGKSFAAALAMSDIGSVLSCDLHPHKERLIQAGKTRLRLQSIQTTTWDAKCWNKDWKNTFDLVIADVPCSGLGIIRKKPDIRYKDPESIARLPEVQGAILETAAHYVKPGGVLLYATCTVLVEENSAVVSQLLDRNPEFQLEAFQLPGPIGCVETGQITLWPHLHRTDGFFFAKLRRLPFAKS